MDTIDIKLVPNDKGGKDVIINQGYNLGALVDETALGKGIAPLRLGIGVLKQNTYENLKTLLSKPLPKTKEKMDERQHDIDTMLENYVTFSTFEKLGVEVFPIVKNKNGEYEGFDRNYAVNVIDNNDAEK